MPRSRSDGARVWIIRLARFADAWREWASVLSQEEEVRMGRFIREDDRFRFGVTRAALRTVLGDILGCRPRDVQLSANRFGRPRVVVARSAPPVCFSVSHSGEYAIIGLARQRPIGVDVEATSQSIAWEEVSRSICADTELEQLRAMSVTDRFADLHHRWTIKEAYLKALGLGLSLEPRKVVVVRAGESSHADSAASGYALCVRGPWTLVLPTISGDYSGAVVIFGAAQRLHIERLE